MCLTVVRHRRPDGLVGWPKVAGERANGKHVTDWLGEPKSFTPWVERG